MGPSVYLPPSAQPSQCPTVLDALLLKRVRTSDAVPGPTVSVLGVDDWAWRKGQRYGTILVDLERRRVVDLLPDRSADTLAAWLADHPGVSAVVRDRAYAEGAARGAPDAIQVADRWHLLRNSSDALRTVLDQHHRDLRAAARTAAQQPEPSMPEDPAVSEPGVPPQAERPMRAAERRSRAAQDGRDARFAEVARLRGQGLSLKAIARTLGLGRKTVRRWLRAGQAPPGATPTAAPAFSTRTRRTWRSVGRPAVTTPPPCGAT